jgi:hypothetical protein
MTTKTAIEIFGEAAEHGLKLSFKAPFTLCVEPRNRCPSDFLDALSLHKPQLLVLLQLPFVMAYSKILEERIFFCEDNATRDALVESGADEGAIYTRSELEILVAQNRVKPFLPDELCKIHAIKKTFSGRITNNPQQ